METLKRRSTAFLIAVIVVLGSTWFGAHRSLGQQTAIVTDQFYEGVYDDSAGYTRASIYSQLSKRSSTALSMLTLSGTSESVSGTPETAEELREARTALQDLLESGSGPRALYSADQDLSAAVDAYYKELSLIFTQSAQSGAMDDLVSLENDYNTLVSAARVIEESGYNEAVREFNRSVLGQFPANLLKAITFVSAPELFA